MVSIPTRDSTVFQIIEEGWNISHEPGVGMVALLTGSSQIAKIFLSNGVTRVEALGDEYPNDPLRSRNNSNNPANAEDICLQRFHGIASTRLPETGRWDGLLGLLQCRTFLAQADQHIGRIRGL